MPRVKKSILDKEKELKLIISDAKQKLKKIQNKQKNDIGELACTHKLNEFSLDVLDKAFKQIYIQLNKEK